MDQETIQRLKSSFSQLRPRGHEFVDRFYAHLFSKNPQLRSMFPKNMAEQKQKLLASLGLVVKNLSTPTRLRDPLMDLGRRHREYGTKLEHYPVMRDTLVSVMGDMAGDTWNQQLESAWKTALDFVASVMLEGAKTSTAQTSA